MILKNEIPIVEYDDCSAEVIAPDHDCEDLKLPEKCLFAFLGDVVHSYAENNQAEAFDKSNRSFEEVLDFMKGKADI